MTVLNNLRRWFLALFAQVERLTEEGELYPLVDIAGKEREAFIWAERTEIFNFLPSRLDRWNIHIGKSRKPPSATDYALDMEIARLPVKERELRINPDDTISLILRGEWTAEQDVIISEWGLSLELKCTDGALYRFLFLREVTLPYTVHKEETIRIGWIITY